MARLTQYNYVFAIGTFFAMLDAYNNGASMYRLLPLPCPHTNTTQTMLPTHGLLQSLPARFPTARL